LADKSLIVADTSGQQERYRLLESTAAYALEKLSASRQNLARRHADYFRAQAQAATERFGTVSTLAWLADVELELDNYRAALEWALTQRNDNVLGAVTAGALGGLWFHAGLGVEGRYWTELALERVNEAEQPHIAARLYSALGGILSGKPAFEATERALQLYESVGDVRGAARAQASLAFALYLMGRLDEASVAIVPALAALRACGYEYMVPAFLSVQAGIEADRGDRRLGRELHTRALAVYKALDEKFGEAIVLVNLAELEFTDEHPEQALHFVNDALEILLHGKNAQVLAIAQCNRAAYCIALGDFTGARESAREALRVAGRQQNERQVADSLEQFALLAALGDDAQRAAQLRGYVDAQNRRLGRERTLAGKAPYERLVAALRGALNEDEIAKLAAEGAAWSEDHAVEEALKV
jgi:tetratricopeptide (TPR) repeat protein